LWTLEGSLEPELETISMVLVLAIEGIDVFIARNRVLANGALDVNMIACFQIGSMK
jgi:hypothetical protein